MRMWSTRIGIRTLTIYREEDTCTPAQAPCGVQATEARDPIMRGKSTTEEEARNRDREGEEGKGEDNLKTGRHKYCEPVKPSRENRARNMEAPPGKCAHAEAS